MKNNDDIIVKRLKGKNSVNLEVFMSLFREEDVLTTVLINYIVIT